MAALFVEMGTLRKDLEDAHASCREASWARVDLQEQVRGLKVSQCQPGCVNVRETLTDGVSAGPQG